MLVEAVDDLIDTIESKQRASKEAIKADGPDADQVHPDGFYFFDSHIHRTMIMVQVGLDGEATVLWAGNHQDMKAHFKTTKRLSRNG